jgi:hypothetical protein
MHICREKPKPLRLGLSYDKKGVAMLCSHLVLSLFELFSHIFFLNVVFE